MALGEGTAALARLMTRAARSENEVLFLTAAEDPLRTVAAWRSAR